MKRANVLAARKEIAILRASRWTDASIAARLAELKLTPPDDERRWTATAVSRFMAATRDAGPGFITGPDGPIRNVSA